jgi:Arc/MetJ-type ribon-helix-helix transcriptional regulator
MKHQPADTEEVVGLSPEEIAELDDRADAVERGEYVDGDEVIRRLRSGYHDQTAETEEEIELDAEELAELDAAMEEAERGEGMDGFEFLKQLRDGTWRDPEVR